MAPYHELPDIELVLLLKNEDECAFTALYKRYWQRMFNSAYKRLQDKELSQDIIQNIFSDLWERRKQLQIDNLPAYLHTAVRFQVFKQTSNRTVRSEFLDAFEETVVCPTQTDDQLLENETLDLFKSWVRALPEKRRKIFLLHYFEDKPTSEIADRLEISQKTVQNQLNTAAQLLRARLSEVLLFGQMTVLIYFK